MSRSTRRTPHPSSESDTAAGPYGSAPRRRLRALGIGVVAASVLAAVPASAGAQILDPLGRPTEPVLGSMESAADSPLMPPEAKDSLHKLVAFFRGSDGGGVALPQNGPTLAQFAYPTVMERCIDGTQSAVGAATAIPGPAALPLPGVPEHQAAFLFTALGTGKVSPVQAAPLTVSWVNVNNGRTGNTPLLFNGINPDGPATVSGIADTGAGTVHMILQGTLTTDIPGGVSQCSPIPTVGTVTIA